MWPSTHPHTQEGCASEAELQSWFVRRISRYLATQHNRRIIGACAAAVVVVCAWRLCVTWCACIQGCLEVRTAATIPGR
jgi:hypothetical protein